MVADRKMIPLWLVRLNAIVLWLNPVLGAVAGVLAMLVAVAASERLSGKSINAATQVVRRADAPSQERCQPSALPPELRDLRLYD